MSVRYDFKKMREIEWDRTISNGAQLAHICPICASHVPVGNNFQGIAYREVHTRWHQSQQEDA